MIYTDVEWPDFWRGVKKLTPKELRAYLGLLQWVYIHERPATDDDMKETLGLTIRGWEHVRDLLLARGRIIRVKGGYMDERARREILEYQAKIASLAERGRAGGKAKARADRAARAMAAGNASAGPLFDTSSAPTGDEFDTSSSRTGNEHVSKSDKMSSEINESPLASAMTYENEYEKEDDSNPCGPLSDDDDVFKIPKRRTRRCPASFTPTLDDLDDKTRDMVATWTADEFATEVDKFKDHEFASPRSDWPATFRNWCRSHHERRPRANGGYSKPSGWDAAQDQTDAMRGPQMKNVTPSPLQIGGPDE